MVDVSLSPNSINQLEEIQFCRVEIYKPSFGPLIFFFFFFFLRSEFSVEAAVSGFSMTGDRLVSSAESLLFFINVFYNAINIQKK